MPSATCPFHWPTDADLKVPPLSFHPSAVDLRSVEPGHLPDAIAAITGCPEVDAAVDCVGFEARGCGHKTCNEVPAQVSPLARRRPLHETMPLAS